MDTKKSLALFQPDEKQLDVIRKTICKDADDMEFNMFTEVCRATGLNPFLHEIWFIKVKITEWDERTKQKKFTGEYKVSIFAGRDGYLKIANNSPQYDGMESEVEYNDKGFPVCAWAKVYRKDRSRPAYFRANFNEYFKANHKSWKETPSAMILKVAEASALKRAFSISGLFTYEEIGANSADEAKRILSGEAEPKGLSPKASVERCAYVVDNFPPDNIRALLDKHKATALRELDADILEDFIADPVSKAVNADWSLTEGKEDKGIDPETPPLKPEPEAQAEVKESKEEPPAPDNPEANVVTPAYPAPQAEPAIPPANTKGKKKEALVTYDFKPDYVCNRWIVTKHEESKVGFKEEMYYVSRELSSCTCPSRKQPCKHITMLKELKADKDKYNALMKKYPMPSSKKAEVKPEAKTEAKPEAKAETKSAPDVDYGVIAKTQGYQRACVQYFTDKFSLKPLQTINYVRLVWGLKLNSELKEKHFQACYEAMKSLNKDMILAKLGGESEGEA